MKHRIGYNRLGRKASHRKALVKNMVTQLYRHERIRTTKSKALEVRRRAEKLITRAKEDSVHNRRIVAKLVQDKAILAKLFTEIAPGFVDRHGGYTRILKLGYRKGDAAEMVLLELVGREEEAPARKKAEKAVVKEESAEAEAAAAVDVEEPAKVAADTQHERNRPEAAKENADSETESGSVDEVEADVGSDSDAVADVAQDVTESEEEQKADSENTEEETETENK